MMRLINGFQKCWKVCLFILLGFVGSFTIAAFLLPNMYVSSALLAPVKSQSSGLGGLVGQLGGLADLAGLSGLNPTEQASALATLNSRSLLEPFINDKKLLPILFSSKWNETEKKWKSDNLKKQPTIWDGYEFFTKRVLSVNDDRRSGLVTLSVKWRDAQVAKDWASDIVTQCNKKLQQEAIADSTRTISYLQQQIQTSNSLEVKQLLYHMLEAEMKKMAVAVTRDDYAFRVIDPPVSPTKPESPNRLLMLIAGFFLGILSSVGYVVYFCSRES